MLESLAKDVVTVEKPDGRQFPRVKASVQPGLIIIPNDKIPLEEGDLITRKLRSGVDEFFEVEERGFFSDRPGMKAHFQAKVKRVTEKRLIEHNVQTDVRKVFVVHGRDERASAAMNDFLRAIGLRPIEWSEAVRLTGDAAPFIGDVVEAGLGAAQAVVVLLTGDDQAQLRPELRTPEDPEHEKQLTPQARPNVLFEAGFAFGRHPKRTVIVEFGKLRPFSDTQGRHVIKMDNSFKQRQALAERLRNTGCEVDTTGTDWHSAGTFKVR